MTHDVFLSYSRKDARLMHRVRDSLDGAGLSAVWTDEGIEPGTPLWDQAIEEALHQARCMVVILTPNSKNAKGVRDEIHYASIHGKRVFPILAAGDAQTSVPYILSGTQWVDARTNYDQAIRQLVSAIQLHLSRSQANRPPQTAPAASIGPSPVSEQRKRRSKRPAWLTALGSVLAVVFVSLLVLLWANGVFNQPPVPAPTLSENEKALTLAAETQVAVIMTGFLTETRIAQVNQTATADAFTDTPTSTNTPSPTDTPTSDETAPRNAQAQANVPTDTPQPTPTPTLTPTVTPSATITDTPDASATQTAEAALLETAQENAHMTQAANMQTATALAEVYMAANIPTVAALSTTEEEKVISTLEAMNCKLEIIGEESNRNLVGVYDHNPNNWFGGPVAIFPANVDVIVIGRITEQSDNLQLGAVGMRHWWVVKVSRDVRNLIAGRTYWIPQDFNLLRIVDSNGNEEPCNQFWSTTPTPLPTIFPIQ